MTIGLVDTHAHAFLHRLPMAPTRRYTPGYDAPVATYLSVLDQHAVAFGVLVQPSFYGTDNSYMVEALGEAGGRLKGIAVVDPAVDDDALERLQAAGVVGVRFNLIGADPALLSTPDHRSLIHRIAARRWQIQVQAQGADWPRVLAALESVDTTLVADHYGLPTPSLGLACPGFQALLASERVVVKLSAPYRLGGADPAAYHDALLDRLGPERLLWGSDWPWTQHEANRRYEDTLALAALAAPTAQRLFGFASAVG
jgi:predicted TIM-barrel fold metal-dependent hydrolase